MQRTIQAINNSIDLAELLNTHAPLTEADAAETPVDWPGVALFDTDGQLLTYDLDRDASGPTRCVLADGHAAVDYKQRWHSCPMFRTMPEIEKPHWCPADYDTTTWDDGEATVTLDWRSVYVGQGSYADTTVYDTVEAAREAYKSDVQEMAAALTTDGDDED